QALVHLDEPVEAQENFKKCLSLDPNNKAAANQLKICQAKIKENKDQKKIYGGMFDMFAQSDAKVDAECSICFSTFNEATHRPRNLPCGHGYCTSCIETCIQGNNKNCPACGKKYRVNRATDLPICYLLEETMQKAAERKEINMNNRQTEIADPHGKEATENVANVKYAQVVRKGIRRSSKTFIEGYETVIPSLSREVNPPRSAVLLEESEMCLNSESTIVFMDLSVGNSNLGRLYIQAFGDRPRGKQFIKLALGTEGPTFKGSKSFVKWGNVALEEYVTETGLPSKKPLITTHREDHYGKRLRGRLFPWTGLGFTDTAGFEIIRWNDEEDESHGYFGYVVAGMNVIERAISRYGIDEVTVSDCGIVLDYW
ncbi:unnamed protein product, partial [Meganyctiphanes norvegica]